MAKRVLVIEEPVSLEDLITLIKKNWHAGLEPEVTFDGSDAYHPKIILSIDLVRVVNRFTLGTPSIQASEAEIKEAYLAILLQIEKNNPCLSTFVSKLDSSTLRFVLNLKINPGYLDPLDIPGPDNPMDPDHKARIALNTAHRHYRSDTICP